VAWRGLAWHGMDRRVGQGMVITVDSREQVPWVFPPEFASVRRGTLRAGDYALHGDDNFAIERKSLDDFCGTVSSGWDRFQRELDRMANFPALVVIVEAGMDDVIWHRYNHERVLPTFVMKRVAQLTMMNVSVLFAGNADIAAGLCWKLLRERAKQLEDLPGA